MKIYTKTGDDGGTGLFGGDRVAKDDPRIDAYGTVDELNAALGMARATCLPPDVDAIVEEAQNDLFVAGAELATPAAAADMLDRRSDRIHAEHIERLERAIDRFEETLPPLREFILPGGSPGAAALHLARTVCRRAERRVVTLSHTATAAAPADVVIYLNRLGDLLFVLARATNRLAGGADVPWRKEI